MSVKGLLWSIVLFLFSSLTVAQNTIQLINSDEVIRLSRHVKLLYETEQRLTLDEVLQRQDEFVWQSSENPNYGFIGQGLWLHTSFSNVTDTQEWVIDIGFAQLDEVDFYLLVDKKLIAHESEGKFSDGQSFRVPTLSATLPYATRVDLFVRIKSQTTSLVAPLDIQAREKHISITFYDNVLWGLFYGGLLILAIYNFVLFFGNREPSLLAYVVYTCS